MEAPPLGNEVGLDLRHHLPALFGRLGIPIHCEQLTVTRRVRK